MWQKAVEKKKEQESKANNQTQSGSGERKDERSQNDEEGKKSERTGNEEKGSANVSYPERRAEDLKRQTIKRLTAIGEKDSFNQNKIERKKRIEELREALAKQSHGAGMGTDKEQIKIGNIGISSPLIDWRKLLKEAVSYNVDWSYKNASVEDGVVTPYLEYIPTPETEILLDTSGSVSETLLRNFLRECKNILQNSRVKVGCFDDEFYGYTEIRNENDIDSMEFQGGGGTNFDVAVNAFTRRVENKIIFTDGEASMPNKKVDAIWIVFGGRKIKPPGGKVITIDDEALEKLLFNYNKTR